jgi:hypothetical protein
MLRSEASAPKHLKISKVNVQKKKSLLLRLNSRLQRALLLYEFGRSGRFVSRRSRPKMAEDVGDGPEQAPTLSTASVLRCEPSAIVMQGPIWPYDDFTFQTLEIYRRHMPGCRLILSTWADFPDDQRTRFERAGIDVVLSEKPDLAGPYNVNMQITGAAAGMRRAVEGGAEWVLKTRTDQRLYHPELLSGLAAFAKSLPPSGAARDLQRHRIFGIGQGTAKFAPYHLSDQTVFGHAEDMLPYWTPPLKAEIFPAHWSTDPGKVFLETPIGDFCRYGAAESYITSQYLTRLGRTLDWTLQDSWAVFRDHLGVVDYGATDFFWAKPHRWRLEAGMFPQEETLRYATINNRRELTFLEWIQLYAGHLRPEDAVAYEGVLSTPFARDLNDAD